MPHGESRVSRDSEVVTIAGAHDRLHGSSVEQAVLDEAFIDVNPDDLTEDDEAPSGLAVDVVEPQGLQPFAFQRAWTGFDARRFHQQRRSGFETDRFHLVAAAWKGP